MSKFAKLFLGVIVITVIVLGLLIIPRTSSKTSSLIPQISHLPLAQQKPPITTLFFAGDIMLSRNVENQMAKTNDYTLPFKNVADEIKQADLSFANLESPFNNQGRHYVPNSLVFNANPKAVAGLNLSGFDVLSTANNHAFDQGLTGINFTYNLLKQNSIEPIGTTDACHEGVVLRQHDITFGYLAYSYTAFNDGGKSRSPEVCDANDLNQVKTDIKTLKNQADIIIVSMHAGTEYTREPNQLQRDFAHAAADAGADLVIGAHPHWIQKPIEDINDRTWVFYSLGNFVFDQMWSQDTREGMTLKITYVGKKLDKIELKPVIIENYCCTRWATEDETKNILRKLDLTSPVL